MLTACRTASRRRSCPPCRGPARHDGLVGGREALDGLVPVNVLGDLDPVAGAAHARRGRTAATAGSPTPARSPPAARRKPLATAPRAWVAGQLDVASSPRSPPRRRAVARARSRVRLHALREGDLVPRPPQRGEQHVNGLEMGQETRASRTAKGMRYVKEKAHLREIFRWRPRHGALLAPGSGRLHDLKCSRERRPACSVHEPVAHRAKAGAAIGAPVPAAVAGRDLGLALPPLVQQELLGDAAPHVIPGQLVPLAELAGGLARPWWRRCAAKASCQACSWNISVQASNRAPARHAGSITSAVRRRRGPARPRASRCARRGARAGAGGSASPGAGSPAWPQLVARRHALPLERRVRLGDEVGGADVDGEAAAARPRPISRARMPRSTMPCTSSWVSRGRPIMKYSLRLV